MSIVDELRAIRSQETGYAGICHAAADRIAALEARCNQLEADKAILNDCRKIAEAAGERFEDRIAELEAALRAAKERIQIQDSVISVNKTCVRVHELRIADLEAMLDAYQRAEAMAINHVDALKEQRRSHKTEIANLRSEVDRHKQPGFFGTSGERDYTVRHEIGGAGEPCPCPQHPINCYYHPSERCGCLEAETSPEPIKRWERCPHCHTEWIVSDGAKLPCPNDKCTAVNRTVKP